MGKLFGTDGVRGVANTELTPELAFRLGRVATAHFGKKCARPVFVVGRDTRISGQMLEAALSAGICSAGGEAIIVGIIPTPAVAYLARTLGAQAGVVISASHNPYPDNGIKFFAGNGNKLPDAIEIELEKLVLAEPDLLARPSGENIGIIKNRHDLSRSYIEHAISTVSETFKGLKVVVDCANGASYEVAPVVLRRLGAEVIVLNDHPIGTNINLKCGSTNLEGLKTAVVSHKADFGIAYDGDADRCLAVDETGQVVDGDQIMVICAMELLRQGKLNDNTLVATVMSNIGLHQAVKRFGGKVVVTQVGDRYVLESMNAKGYSLGGEQSGHIIFSEYCTTGDGIVTSLQLIAALVKSGKKMSELAALMTIFPQLLQNVRVGSKDGWQDNAAIKAAIKAAEDELGETGRVLVRPSGTEPLIRVMAEGPSNDVLERLVNEVADVIRKELAG
ncbi:MAG: glmM [Firmicutes bacterium]|nr:glmM [Bacillota bacterium]